MAQGTPKPWAQRLKESVAAGRQAWMGQSSTPPLEGEVGWGGAKITGGIVQDEHNAALYGKAAIAKAVEMRRSDPTVRMVEKVVGLPIRSTKWLLEEPKNPSTAEKEATERCRRMLFGGMECSFDDLLREGAAAIYHGWGVPEIVWQQDKDGFLSVRKLAPRNRENLESWLYYNNGELAGYLYSGSRPIGSGLQGYATASSVFERVPIPIEKTVHFVCDGENDNPQGFGLWRSMYGPWYIKQSLLKVMCIGLERNLLDVPVGKMGTGAQPTDRAKLLTILKRWRAAEDAAVVLPEGFGLEFIGSNRSPMDGMPMLAWVNFQITAAGLCTFLNLGQTAVGTQALGGELAKTFLDAENAYANWIGETLDKQLLKRWTLLNYGEGVRAPKLMHRRISARDYSTLTNSLVAMVNGGILHATPDDEEHLRDNLDLPAIPKEQLEKLEAERAASAKAAAEAQAAQARERLNVPQNREEGATPAKEEAEEAPEARAAVDDLHGHTFADVEAERAAQDQAENAFTRGATEILTGIQERYEKLLTPLIAEAADETKLRQGKPIDRIPDVAMPGMQAYTDYVKSFLWDAFNTGRKAQAKATGQPADGPVSNRMRQWITAKAETIAQGHLGMLKSTILNRVLTGLRAEMSAEQIFSDAGAEATERLNAATARDWNAAAAEVLALMSEG